MMGIEYIKIVSDRNDWRFKLADSCMPFVEPKIREMFKSAGMELLAGSHVHECSISELKGRYDLHEGIDMILYFKDETRGTLQLKTLFTSFKTATFETEKNSGKPGAWFYCTAQYYAIVYTEQSKDELISAMGTNNFNPVISDGIIINYPDFHKQVMNNKVKWENNINKYDGRRSAFQYVYFNQIPDSSVIAKYPASKPDIIQLKLY